MSDVRSQLAHLAPLCREPQPGEGWAIAKDAWHTHGIVVLNLAEVEARHGWVAARSARNLAEQCFGKRKIDKR